MIRPPPRSTLSSSSAASDVYKRQHRDMTIFFMKKLKAAMKKLLIKPLISTIPDYVILLTPFFMILIYRVRSRNRFLSIYGLNVKNYRSFHFNLTFTNRCEIRRWTY